MGAVALFGGSFDPVHLGHINAVRSLLREVRDIGRVIIMPAYVNPFKAGEAGGAVGASPMQRVEMCRIAFGDIPRCMVSDFEARREGPSYTYVTLRALREEFPGKELILTVGSDSLKSLPGWKNSEEIFRCAVIAAAARSDGDLEEISRYAEEISRLGGRVRVIPITPFDISSTQIRKKILNNEDLTCYMDKNVVKYITENKIYGK